MSILRRIPSIDNQISTTAPGVSTSPTVRKIASPIGGAPNETYKDLKNRVQNKLLTSLDPSMDVTKTAEVRKTIQELFDQILIEENIVLSRAEKHACSNRSLLRFWVMVHYNLCWMRILLQKLW